MIIVALINLFTFLLGGVTTARPAWNLTIPVTAVQSVQYLFSMDNIIPVSETCICASATFGLFIVFNFTKWGIKVIDWVADIIP